MATVAHTIYSHYDPKDREFLERETGQIPSSEPPSDAASEEQWRRESAQVYKRALPPGPVFVPAKIADGEWASQAPTPLASKSSKDKSNVAGWYKSLTGDTATPTPGPSAPPQANPVQQPTAKRSKGLDKNTWFIQNVISTSSSSSNTPTPFSIPSTPSTTLYTPPPPPTLAEILDRDPPPSKTDAKYTPPVWIALGPGNRGFGMLQKSGWNEGEALGPYAPRRGRGVNRNNDDDISMILGEGKGKEKEEATTSVEYVEVSVRKGKRSRAFENDEDDDGIVEIRKVEVVDLTELSTDESGSGEDDGAIDDQATVKNEGVEGSTDLPPVDDEVPLEGHGGTALLTPISTILKSDRLGIGLKPKLVSSATAKGAYRVPVLKDTKRNQGFSSKGFRVTSTQGVLSEIKRREQEEKAEREFWGRGRRGKERKRRREESERKGLLAYMNE